MSATPAVQHVPVVKHDLREALQDPAAGIVYVSWEAFVTCSEASVAAVAVSRQSAISKCGCSHNVLITILLVFGALRGLANRCLSFNRLYWSVRVR
jgi:hypothetical protein